MTEKTIRMCSCGRGKVNKVKFKYCPKCGDRYKFVTPQVVGVCCYIEGSTSEHILTIEELKELLS